MSNRLPRRIALCFIAGLFSLGCELPPAAGPGAGNSNIDTSLLLSYQGPVRGLFDDGIDTEVFGAPGDQAPGEDRRLSERVRSSGLVVVVQVTTVSDEAYSQTGRLDIELTPVEAPILGLVETFSQEGEGLRVNVSPGTGSYALLQSNQNDLIGKRLILCLGRFVENGKPVIHWHAMADSPKVRQAVTKSASMADLEN